METKYILACDIGTQSLRVAIIDSTGKTEVVKQEKYAQPYFSVKNGYCEQNPDFYYEIMCKLMKDISKNNQELLSKCLSLSLTMFRDSAALLDENYNIVRPTILWLDQRNAKLTENLPWYNTLLFKLIGMNNTVIYNRKRTPAWWLRENEQDNWNKIKYYVPLTAYLTYRLTGKLVDSSANCTGHYPINFKKGEWLPTWHPKFSVFGVPKEKLCQLVKPGEIIGSITEASSKETGLPVGMKIYACGTDKSCETFGNGCVNESQITISYGTACTVDVPTVKYGEPERFLPGYCGCYPGIYNREVQIYRGYWMLTWFIQNFATDEIIEAKKQGVVIEEIFDNKIADIEPGSNGLILQPYWGPGLKRPLARGAVIGFSDTHTKYHLYRAMIEGICYALKEGLLSIRKKQKNKIQYLVVSGGGSRNDIICQITADIFNFPVRRTKCNESALQGAAMAGFLFNGVFQTPEQAKNSMVVYEKEFLPNKENAKKYQYLYNKVYKKVYPQLKKSYRVLKEYSSNEIL